MTLEKYFDIIHNLLERHWAIAEKHIVYDAHSKDSAQIEGKITLLDGSFLVFSEEVFINKKALFKGKYRYQYVKESEVFRYDNYPRHRGISAPFHHKHTASGVFSLAAPPKLIDIIEEAVRHIF